MEQLTTGEQALWYGPQEVEQMLEGQLRNIKPFSLVDPHQSLEEVWMKTQCAVEECFPILVLQIYHHARFPALSALLVQPIGTKQYIENWKTAVNLRDQSGRDSSRITKVVK